MEKFITASGFALRVSDSGLGRKPAESRGQARKPVLVLLHGYLESLDVWEEFSKLLTPYFRVIAPDLPGHGISEVKGDIHTMELLAGVVEGMLDKLEVDKCYMAGHSMGGYVALEFLRKYPSRLSGLILVHSTPDQDTQEKKDNRAREIAIVDGGKKELLFGNAAKGFAEENRKKFSQEIAGLTDQIVLTDDEGIVAILRGMCERRDSNAVLKESSVPQLFIFGKKDEYIPYEKSQDIARNNPQAWAVWLGNSGHMGFIEEPEKTAEIIMDFAGVRPEKANTTHGEETE